MENMDFLPQTAPSLVFARETYTPYLHVHLQQIVLISKTVAPTQMASTPSTREDNRCKCTATWQQMAVDGR